MLLTSCCYCIPLKRGCEVIAAITIIVSILEIFTITPIVKPWMVAVVVLVYLIVMGLSVLFLYAIEKQLIFIVYLFVYVYWVYAVLCIAMALTIQILGKQFISTVLKQPKSDEESKKMANGKDGGYFLMFIFNLYFILVIYSFYKQEVWGYEEDDDESQP
ncbi:hypothetical protein ILUMI_08047 [Ignelater luminosus]|uniref:Uncharacterized protein n=1 Tax=Ignelater luminosus TaxID=2038154 RepID=A0A8K0GHE9_IGNLU|nr:hypothetical protein ILUMI_08047 [Ignelater luminosus]